MLAASLMLSDALVFLFFEGGPVPSSVAALPGEPAPLAACAQQHASASSAVRSMTALISYRQKSGLLYTIALQHCSPRRADGMPCMLRWMQQYGPGQIQNFTDVTGLN